MSCSRAFACSRSVCSLGIGTASFSQQFGDGREDRRGVGELREDDEPHRQNGALPATAASIIASMRSVFARICRPVDRVRQVGLAGGGGVADTGPLPYLRQLEGWQATSHETRVEGLGLPGLALAHGGRRVVHPERVLLHAVIGQRQHHVRAGGVDVQLLAEAVAVEQVGASHARRQGRQGPRVEGQGHVVPGLGDHEEVVGARQQLADVAGSRVAAGRDFPG